MTKQNLPRFYCRRHSLFKVIIVQQLVSDYFQRILLKDPNQEEIEAWTTHLEAAEDLDVALEAMCESLLAQAVVVRSVIQLYTVVFDRKPDFEGLWFWTSVFRDIRENNPDLSYGDQLVKLIANWLESDEFVEKFSDSLSDADFVRLLYLHVLDREPDDEGYDHWTAALEAGLSRETLIVLFSESQEFRDGVTDEANGLLKAGAVLASVTKLDDPDYIIPENDPYQGTLRNNAPIDIVIDGELVVYWNTVEDGMIVGSMLQAVDIDGGDAHTFELINDGGGVFRLAGANTSNPSITVADFGLIDFETTDTITIEIKVTDRNGGVFTKQFSIGLEVADENGLPQDLSYYFHRGTRPDGEQIPPDITGWVVRHVTDMRSMFNDARDFNQDIGGWDVGNVVDMSFMFFNAFDFNQDIGSWDTANVQNMASMFSSSIFPSPSNFNQDISSWDTGSVTSMGSMFRYAHDFDQDISGWETANVRSMQDMFDYASSFNQDIGNWDISSLTNAYGMLDRSGLDTQNFDRLLAGWSTLDIDGGETAIKIGIGLGAQSKTYTDLTSFSVLKDDYRWNIQNATLSSSVTAGTDNAETLGESSASDNQIIHALDGDDTVFGGAGNDLLNGGYGNDILTGGDGADVFSFQDGFFDSRTNTPTGFGSDTITDFATGEDKISLVYVMTIEDFTDLLANHLTQSGDDVVITDFYGNSITLLGVTAASLTEDDFIFF